MWIDGAALRPEAQALLARLAQAGGDNLDPARYGTDRLAADVAAARAGDATTLARAEFALSRAYADFLVDLHRPNPAVGMVYVHDGLAPPERTPRQWLEEAARAPLLVDHLAAATRLNPVYEELRAALAAHRARPAAPGSEALERTLRANLERARALPADPGRRFLLVDAASATLRAYEDGRVVDTMPVIVGKPSQPTPLMAGRMDHVILNPYWNLPPDLAQVRARRVLQRGHAVLRQERLESLSGWEADARLLTPQEIDWKAVAARRETLRMRQTPGPHNMMGDIKFMFPNRLGIYLHDTPNKAPFKGGGRRLSSGCVRLEDAPRLARWLFGRPVPTDGAPPEQRLDLPEPVPVYITYLTVEPRDGPAVARPDPDKRDAALIAALERTPAVTTAAPAVGAR